MKRGGLCYNTTAVGAVSGSRASCCCASQQGPHGRFTLKAACRQGYGSWRWGWVATVAASTHLCPQVPRDWVGEERSSVSLNIPLYLVGWLPKEMHFIGCRSVCVCLSVCPPSPEILGSGGCQPSMSEGQRGRKKAKL